MAKKMKVSSTLTTKVSQCELCGKVFVQPLAKNAKRCGYCDDWLDNLNSQIEEQEYENRFLYEDND